MLQTIHSVVAVVVVVGIVQTCLAVVVAEVEGSSHQTVVVVVAVVCSSHRTAVAVVLQTVEMEYQQTVVVEGWQTGLEN